jgi:hypothetical protein
VREFLKIDLVSVLWSEPTPWRCRNPFILEERVGKGPSRFSFVLTLFSRFYLLLFFPIHSSL